uniref:RAB11 family interacting protein 4 n=1 Tax=Molossus molossus TaxID=27622 RepID=A0A7J8D177_MOLMO|nr:RAB11 family interacting protein 4 [Molossus molossus]
MLQGLAAPAGPHVCCQRTPQAGSWPRTAWPGQCLQSRRGTDSVGSRSEATAAASQVEKLVKYLDPNDLGRINFKDFCRGVFAMKGCEELLKDVLSMEGVGTLPCAPEIPDCVEQAPGGDHAG